MSLVAASRFLLLLLIVACVPVVFAVSAGEPPSSDGGVESPTTHREAPAEPDTAPPVITGEREVSPPGRSVCGPYVSVQVNVNDEGMNILGDAANEPSIAVDPTNPSSMAIGWRQFDTIDSNFRQAGVGFTRDGGQTWTFSDVLNRGVFRSDPVLDFDADGRFYYNSLSLPQGLYVCDVFRSQDGGASWSRATFAFGGDKAWMTVDRTDGVGRGNIYTTWSAFVGCCGAASFSRSTDGGRMFETPIEIPEYPKWGTLSVGPDGTLYIAGLNSNNQIAVIRSSNAQDPDAIPSFELVGIADLGGYVRFGGGPNPGGLLGQVWIATDHSQSATHGNVYVLASVNPPGPDPLDVMFARSTDGGATWTEPMRVNDDPTSSNAWQWFGTISVAPNGRIDAVWNDTRNASVESTSQLYHAFSLDGGSTWSRNTAISGVFNSHLGWPRQNKLGDYIDMVSDNLGVSIAYAATFNAEQDVYFLRIGEFDCNDNGIADGEDIAAGTSDDCNDNSLPDECEPDCNGNGVADPCDVTGSTSDDCDGNFVPDECERDFDGDGLIDNCDPDSDSDGVPEEADDCPFTPPDTPVGANGGPIGDTNGDCVVDLIDYWRFHRCFVGAGPGITPEHSACVQSFDYDGDGYLDLSDFAGFQNAFAGGD